MLERRANPNGTVKIITNQHFYKADGAGENAIERRVVNCFVPSNDTGISGSFWDIFIDLALNLCLKCADSTAEESGSVYVCYGRIDI